MAAFINLRNLVWAEMTDEEAETYDTPVPVGALMQAKDSTKVNSETLYGDGERKEVASALGESTLEVDVNSIDLALQAKILGHDFDTSTNRMTIKATDQAPYGAVGYMIERSNGKNVYVWFLKGRAEEIETDVKQKEDKVSFSTPSIKWNFIDRSTDHRLKEVYDEEETGTVPANILDSVPTASATA